ncbi:MAG: DUF63 family protein [Candidatus Diapherotrites archaeon]|nr:DUF63 family protein [Candidatus Diapherotrites archaeon]
MAIDEFIMQYFIRPIYTGEGYNIYNTIVYGLILIVSLYGIIRLARRFNVKINKKLFDAVVPFIVLGGIIRALEDYAAAVGLGKHWLFITPGIYLFMFSIFLITLAIVKAFGKEYETLKKIGWFYVLLSLLLVVFNVVLGKVVPDFAYLISVLTCASISSLIVLFIVKRFMLFETTKENIYIVWGQMLDASASAIAIAFLGYNEQHIISGMIIGINPFLFIPVKMLVALLALYMIEKHEKNENWKWLLKMVVLTLGMATGTRDAVRAFMGV